MWPLRLETDKRLHFLVVPPHNDIKGKKRDSQTTGQRLRGRLAFTPQAHKCFNPVIWARTPRLGPASNGSLARECRPQTACSSTNSIKKGIIKEKLNKIPKLQIKCLSRNRNLITMSKPQPCIYLCTSRTMTGKKGVVEGFIRELGLQKTRKYVIHLFWLCRRCVFKEAIHFFPSEAQIAIAESEVKITGGLNVLSNTMTRCYCLSAAINLQDQHHYHLFKTSKKHVHDKQKWVERRVI